MFGLPLLGGNSVNLGWKHSPSANVAGYWMDYGPASGVYTNRLDTGYTNFFTVSNLVTSATYYFVVVAYSSYGDESPPSNEVNYTPMKRPDPVRNLVILANMVF